MNTTVSITKRIDRKYYPVAYNTNGSIKPGIVKIKGVETALAGGNFYINYYQGKKAIRESVGPEAGVARNKRDKKVKELVAIANGVKAGLILVAPSDDTRTSLESAGAGWLDEISEHKDHKTFLAYRVAVRLFLESCEKLYVDQVTREDMMEFTTYLRNEYGHSDRTVANKFSAIMSFMNWAKVDVKLGEYDWPQYTNKKPVVYSQDQLDKLYAACTPDERLLFRFFEKTGFREGEVMNAQWVNVDETQAEITIRAVDGWKPKKNRERTVTVDDAFMAELIEARKASSSKWMFPSEDGKRGQHYLRKLKAIAVRAGLNADDFWLHKFRAHNATKNLRGGLDPATVGSLLGHTSVASTQRYLSALQGPELRARINQIQTS